MFTLSKSATFSQDIKKSRFTALAMPISSEAEAKDWLQANSVPDANHNCWAWRIGQTYRFSDDGEPSGTAGKPILQAIDGQEIDRVVVVVTRWFGGILLGSGGLMRAYGGSAASCLRLAEKAEVIATVPVRFHVGFSDLALVKSRLQGFENLTLTAEDFGAEGADLSAELPELNAETIALLIKDITSGRVVISLPEK
jgi:uncharacterized YigZ family protein